MKKILRNNEGFSLVETLVSIVIAGITITLGITAYTSIISNPDLTYKNEAFLLASDCIDNSLSNRAFSDTAYYNSTGYLRIERKVIIVNSLNLISVEVTYVRKNKRLILLEVLSKD